MSSDFDDDDFDEDDYKYIAFGTQVGEALTPNVKQYLADHYGDKMAELEAQTYLNIEDIIKNAFYYECDTIPDLLYNNRSIPHDEFDAAADAYTPTGKTFNWPKPDSWFDREFGDDDEDEDTYLQDSDPIDLTEQESIAKQAIEAADNLLDGHAAFASFTKKGYETLSKNVQQYFEDRASFDLEILTQEGFEELQETIFFLIAEMLDKLYGVIETDLKNKK